MPLRIVSAGALAILLLPACPAPVRGQLLLRNAGEPPAPPALLPFSRIAVEGQASIGGIGFNVATPLSRRFNLRSGADFFSYSTTFSKQGAHINANLLLRSGHGPLDWFPFAGRFRVCPLAVFGNNNQGNATAVIPSGSTITLDGQNFFSDSEDPLHGDGSVNFRKVSPGLSLDTGNLITRKSAHFSLPLEAGLYYAGQPGLKIAFTGSACNPFLPRAVGCLLVENDLGIQQDLNALIARNSHNLSYVSYIILLSPGVGHAF